MSQMIRPTSQHRRHHQKRHRRHHRKRRSQFHRLQLLMSKPLLPKKSVLKKTIAESAVVLPDALKNITKNDIKDVVVESIVDEDGNTIDTAVSLHDVLLEPLLTVEIRKVCMLLGCSGYRSKKKGECCYIIASRKHQIANYKDYGITNDTLLLKQNTLLRIINALFHEDNFSSFSKLNENKTRTELDKGNAGNNKQFHINLSDYVKDAMNNDRIGALIDFSPGEDVGDRISNEGTNFNLNNYLLQTHVKISDAIKELIKKWEGVETNMKLSGYHENDPYPYCNAGGFPLYYFVLMVNANNAEDSLKPKISSFLREAVKLDSGDVGSSSKKAAVKSNKKSRNDDHVVEDQLIAIRNSTETQMQLLMNAQENTRIEQMIHNKVIELSDAESKIDVYMDVSMDENQPEWKRTRAAKRLVELHKQVSDINKTLSENQSLKKVLDMNDDITDDDAN